MDYSIMYAGLGSDTLKYDKYCRFCGNEAIHLDDEYYDCGLYCGCDGALRYEENTMDIRRTERELKEYEKIRADMMKEYEIGYMYRLPEHLINENRSCKLCGYHTIDNMCKCKYSEGYNDESISIDEREKMADEVIKQNLLLKVSTLKAIYGGLKK